jgi:Cys-rich four helix bundle protein (predicted Tat secretion target)
MLATSLAVGSGIAATIAGSGLARAHDEHEEHEHHDKHEHHEHHAEHDHGPAPHQALIAAALDCISTGEVCANHCIEMLSDGDTSLKDCLRTVSAMLPMCPALVRLAAIEDKHLDELAKVFIAVCSDCEAACKKHEDEHAECKACAKSCAACIAECKKLG